LIGDFVYMIVILAMWIGYVVFMVKIEGETVDLAEWR